MRSMSSLPSLALILSLVGCGPMTYVTPGEHAERIAELDEDGDGVTKGQNDCNDLPGDGGEHETPGAEEIPYDGWDNDCGGDGDLLDIDGDGFAGISQEDWFALAQAAGWEGGSLSWPDDVSPDKLDCDDNDALVFPEANDARYDGVDSDCGCDEDFDSDGDGHVPAQYWQAHLDFLDSHVSCGMPPLVSGDCDDLDNEAYNNNTDFEDLWYDGRDTDCAGNNDFDQDGDGYIPAAYETPFGQFVAKYGYTELELRTGDCEDADTIKGVSPAAVYPGAADPWYDGVDQDCRGDNDFDQDLDGWVGSEYEGAFIDFRATWNTSLPEPEYGDCDDTDATVHPGLLERFGDSVDQDCDGGVDTTPWAFEGQSGELAWVAPVRPVAGRDGNHFLVSLTATSYEFGSDRGVSLVFEPDAGWMAPADEDIWQGLASSYPLSSGLDMMADSMGYSTLLSYYRGAPYNRTLYKIYDMSWTGEYYLAANCTNNQETSDDSLDMDLQRASDGRLWGLACGQESLQQMVVGEDLAGKVASSPVAFGFLGAGAAPAGTSCAMDLVNEDIYVTDGATLHVIDFTENGSAIDFEVYESEPTAIVSMDARDGWLFEVYAGTGGVTLENPSSGASYDLLSGIAVNQVDAHFFDQDGDGTPELYMVASVSDQDADGLADVLLVYGDPSAPSTLVLPLYDDTGAFFEVEEATLHVDEDRILVASTGKYGAKDVVGWFFLGW